MLAMLTSRNADPTMRLVVADWLEEHGRTREANLLRSCPTDLVILGGRVACRWEVEALVDAYRRAQAFWQQAGSCVDPVEARFLTVQQAGSQALAALQEGDREKALDLLDECCRTQEGLPPTLYWIALRELVRRIGE